jgi:hypothetical protein
MTVTDGPFAETKELIGGYAIIQANSKQEAIEQGRRFMQLHADILGDSYEGQCEVRQMFDPGECGSETKGTTPGFLPWRRSGTATEPALRNPRHASPPAKGASRKFIETAGMRRASHAKTKKRSEKERKGDGAKRSEKERKGDGALLTPLFSMPC